MSSSFFVFMSLPQSVGCSPPETFASLIPPPLCGGPPVYEVTGDYGSRRRQPNASSERRKYP